MLFLLYLMWIYSSKVPQKTALLEHLMFVAFQLFILQELRNVRKNNKKTFLIVKIKIEIKKCF